MFAVGIQGIDLSSTQRYFDISLVHRTYTKNGSSTSREETIVPLNPCTKDQWEGVNNDITQSY